MQQLPPSQRALCPLDYLPSEQRPRHALHAAMILGQGRLSNSPYRKEGRECQEGMARNRGDRLRKVMHRVWEYFQARLAFTMAAFHVLVRWHGLPTDEQGFVPLSIVEFSL
jgi:hypothetical protein